MTNEIKNRLLIAGIVLAVIAAGALMLILQPVSVKADASKPSETASSSSAPVPTVGVLSAPVPNLSAANPGQSASAETGARPPEQAHATDLPTAPPVTEPYKQAAEKAGNEFLKIYFNAPGASMETPSSYVDKLSPYASKAILDQLHAATPSNAQWSSFGKKLHDKQLNYTVAPSCSLAPGQAFAPKFDEKGGGNMPCSFSMTITGQAGAEYAGNDLPVATKSNGSQSLKMINEDGTWKVAAFDSYGQ